MPWDRLRFECLPEESVLVSSELSANGRPSRSKVIRTGVCPFADLSHGFEEYLKNLSARTRAGCRRSLREADR